MSASDLVVVVVSVVGSLVAWLLADAGSKARSEIVAKRADLTETKVNTMEMQLARSEQDRREIHAGLERLDASKASKELVEAEAKQLERFMIEIDRRFDKLETMIENQQNKKT